MRVLHLRPVLLLTTDWLQAVAYQFLTTVPWTRARTIFAKLDTCPEVMGRLALLGRILEAVPASLERARALKRRTIGYVLGLRLCARICSWLCVRVLIRSCAMLCLGGCCVVIPLCLNVRLLRTFFHSGKQTGQLYHPVIWFRRTALPPP